MSRLRSVLVAVGATAVVGVIAVSVAAESQPTGTARHADRPLPQPSQGRCPQQPMQTLPGDAVGRAALAALEQTPAVYRATDLKGARVTTSSLARETDIAYARVKCGRRAQARTVVVRLEFPAMRPSASLSQGTVLVSRFGGEYRVWAQLH